MMKKSQYYKIKNKRTTFMNTLKIVVTAAVVALLGILLSCGLIYGWQAVIDFFKGSFFCFIIILIITIGCVSLWILSFVSNARKVKEND